MVSIRVVGANQTIVRVGNAILYFSYETCVAANLNGNCVRTDKQYSSTTSKHIGQMRCKDFHVVPEERFRALLAKVHYADEMR